MSLRGLWLFLYTNILYSEFVGRKKTTRNDVPIDTTTIPGPPSQNKTLLLGGQIVRSPLMAS